MKWYGRWTLTGVLYVQQAVGMQSESQVHVMSINIGGTYGTVKITCINIFKPGTPGFLKLILCESFVCMFVCVSTPEAINN